MSLQSQPSLFESSLPAVSVATPTSPAVSAVAPVPLPSATPSSPDVAPRTAPAELWAAVQFDPGPASLTPGEREARQAALVRRAGAFTPRVTLEPPDALLFELAGSCRLFGGLAPLLQQLREVFPAPLSIALAPLPLAALVFARAGRARCLTNAARLSSRLAPLPLALLRWPESDQQRLRAMGVTTLGELLRLPREGLARRLGPARLDELDRLLGRRADPRRSVPPAERFVERVDPGFETANAERLLLSLGPALERLEDFLRTRQRGVLALRLTLVHRRLAPTVLLLRLVVPEYRAARFTALLAARLESLPLPAPVRRIDLVAGRLRRLPGDSTSLWQPGEHGGDAGAVAPEFLQTLMARLGERAVHGLAVTPEHRPERQVRSIWPRLGAMAAGSASTREMAVNRAVADEAPDYRSRPLALLPQPLPLETRRDAGGRVQYLLHQQQMLQLVSGPERIESGWWDGSEIARDYYVARASDGALWWVFRDCSAAREWHVHGCFA